MANFKKIKKVSKDSKVPTLSADVIDSKKLPEEKISMDLVAKKIFDEVNNKELQKSLDKWLKEHQSQNAIAMRDLGLLKAIVSEYLDCFIVFGYTLEGERVILQNYQKARDRDAIMEFLKTIFIKQQQENFLD
jgi:hypothetical protein